MSEDFAGVLNAAESVVGRFAEAACARIAALEAENARLREAQGKENERLRHALRTIIDRVHQRPSYRLGVDVEAIALRALAASSNE
jgi:hypothetical protein